jgi:hypothetical protein
MRELDYVGGRIIEQTRGSNMKSNLKLLLSTIGVAALLASPAMADSSARHHSTVRHRTAPAAVSVPNNAYGYKGQSEETVSGRWCATHPYSWDACHDPRENPQ